jgi:hypothetical protein
MATKKKKDGRASNGGKRPNSGRKPLKKTVSNYAKALKILDDNVDEILKGLIDLAKHAPEVKDRIRAADIILKKCIADKKAVEVTGDNNSPLRIVISDKFLPRIKNGKKKK